MKLLINNMSSVIEIKESAMRFFNTTYYQVRTDCTNGIKNKKLAKQLEKMERVVATFETFDDALEFSSQFGESLKICEIEELYYV